MFIVIRRLRILRNHHDRFFLMIEYNNSINGLVEIVNNNPMWSFPALMILDSYIQPGSSQLSGVLSKEEQQKYIDMLANELPHPSAILKQIIIHKLNGDDNGAMYYANLLAHGFPFFKEEFANDLERMSPEFVNEVKVIRDFHYTDKSIFANKLFKDSTQKEG